MRILLDAALARGAAADLRLRGHDVLHADDVGAGAADEELLQVALQESRVIFTLDADFHAMLAETSGCGPSVARLRVQSLGRDEAVELVCRVIESCEQELLAGAAVSATRRTIRVRRLPLV